MIFTDKLKRSVLLATAALLFVAGLTPLLSQKHAGAYALAPNRSVTMSSSQLSATSVTYHVKFDVATTGNVGGIVVQFCDNSPIVGDTTCSAIAGFNVGTPTVSGYSSGANTDPVNGDTGTANISTLTTSTALTTSAVAISNGTAVSLTAAQKVFFDITTITNPSTSNHTFYARIYTYATAGGATGYSVATPGTYVDAGGAALSTANQITITSKVQERLTFCVYTDAGASPSNDCTAKSGNTILLGDTNGVLDPSGPYVDRTAWYGVTTNASGNAAIRLKGKTLKLSGACSDAINQNCSVNAIGAAVGTTTTRTVAGSEQFGLCTYQFAGSGMTVAATYDGTGGASGVCANATQTSGTGSTGGAGTGAGATDPYFGYDTATATGPTGTQNLTSAYGQTIATKPAGSFSTGRLTFIGNIANTTEPGIYTTALTFVATGTY